ncbi:MAG: hypothetical protein AB3N19_05715, partial [Ruegeria sp.]
DDALFYFVEISDRILSVSYIENGQITESGASEAKLASISYLRNYLPSKLEKRSRSGGRGEVVSSHDGT